MKQQVGSVAAYSLCRAAWFVETTVSMNPLTRKTPGLSKAALCFAKVKCSSSGFSLDLFSPKKKPSKYIFLFVV